MPINLVTVDCLVLVAYVMALFIFGFFINRQQKKSNADIFLGGRSLRWWQIGFSMFSANAGPLTLIGFSSLGFSHGVVGFNFEWLGWIFLMLLAMVFLPRYLSSEIRTMPQFLLLRFGRRSYFFLIIYSLISILVVWLGSALYAGGLVLSQVFHCSLWQAVLVVAVISTSYTAIGGFNAVVRTGIFQSLIIIISCLVLTGLALAKAGGIHQVIAAVPADRWRIFRPASDPEYSWVAILAGYPVVAIYYWCADQTIVQKTLAARNIREGQYGTMFMAALKILTPFIFIVPGIICFALFRDSSSPDNAYITLVSRLMPDGLRGLAVAAIIAALIDTVSSGLNSFSTVFTLDIIGKYTKFNEKETRRAGRYLTVLAAVLAICLANLFGHSGKALFELTQGLVSIMAPPLTVVFLIGTIWKRVNSIAAETVLYGGGFVCLAIGICYVTNYPYRGFWPHFLLLSVYLFGALAAVMVLVTLVTGRKNTTGLRVVAASAASKGVENPGGIKWVWVGWGILAMIMTILYLAFS